MKTGIDVQFVKKPAIHMLEKRSYDTSSWDVMIGTVFLVEVLQKEIEELEQYILLAFDQQSELLASLLLRLP